MARKKENIEERILEELSKLKEKYNISSEEWQKIVSRFEKNKDEIEEYVKKHPVKSVVIALIVGVILGRLSK